MEIAEIEKQLEEALAKSTPGEMVVEGCYNGARTVCQMRSAEMQVCVNMATPGRPYKYSTENAELFALAHNSLPALLAHLREQRAALRVCGEALRDISGHSLNFDLDEIPYIANEALIISLVQDAMK